MMELSSNGSLLPELFPWSLFLSDSELDSSALLNLSKNGLLEFDPFPRPLPFPAPDDKRQKIWQKAFENKLERKPPPRRKANSQFHTLIC